MLKNLKKMMEDEKAIGIMSCMSIDLILVACSVMIQVLLPLFGICVVGCLWVLGILQVTTESSSLSTLNEILLGGF